MGKKLYVGNLSYNIDSQALGDIFSEVGTVESSNVITDRETGRSKGFGFIEMADNEAADSAIQRFNGADLDGRAMNVSEAKPQAPRTQGSRGGGFNSRRSY